jgi:mannose-6-phosphate isomerase-like protein (cupin superfamily)
MDSGELTRSKAMKVAIATQAKPTYVPGRRDFFKYRDLGVTAGTNGRLRAQVTSAATAGMTEPTGWHRHLCEAQFVYILKGWVELEFEAGKTIRFGAGDSVMIPGGTPHQETATSDDVELLEVSLPAEMATEGCDPP